MDQATKSEWTDDEYQRITSDLTKIANMKAEKAKKQAKRKAGQKGHTKAVQDFNLEKANIIKIKKKYAYKGTVLLGFRLNGINWRFGHHPNSIHPRTIISVEGGDIYELETQKIYDFIEVHRPVVIKSKYWLHLSEAYQVDIEELVEWCSQKALV
jgi:hypothetical protein